MENINDNTKYYRAKEKVEEQKKFYTSLISYMAFILFLGVINYYSNGWGYPWFLWAAFGWGISIVLKAFKIFGIGALLGNDWEERKIKEFMKDNKSTDQWK